MIILRSVDTPESVMARRASEAASKFHTPAQYVHVALREIRELTRSEIRELTFSEYRELTLVLTIEFRYLMLSEYATQKNQVLQE